VRPNTHVVARQTIKNSARQHLRDLQIKGLAASGQLKAARSAASGTGSVFVLTLHRIVPDDQVDACRSPRGMVLRESLFAALLNYLQANANVVAPNDALAISKLGDKPRVLITFDDGWLDNFTVAQPYLAAAGAKACFFIPTRLTGKREPFWPERLLGLFRKARSTGSLAFVNHNIASLSQDANDTHPVINIQANDEASLSWFKQFSTDILQAWISDVSRQLQASSGNSLQENLDDPLEQVMTWDQIRIMAKAGHKIGSHGCTHEILPLLETQRIRHELVDSFADLQDEIPDGDYSRWLSYPNGSASQLVAFAAAQTGYERAFINSPGRWSPPSHTHLLPRINIWDGTLTDTNGQFSAKHFEYALYWKTRHA
jgi:peptidoglycan/xylan/chitin deacetylase (PgdA/CDA1 family)